MEKKLLEKTPSLSKIIESNFNKRNNDVIFLLDISESMSCGNREDYALREILKVLKYFNHFTILEGGRIHGKF